MTLRGKIAFIDDEIDLCQSAEDWLSASGFEVSCWTNPLQALQEIKPFEFDVIVTDLRMPGLMGSELMKELHQNDADLPVILMSAHADVPAAVAAMREGALDFLEKPFLPEHLVALLDRAVDWRRLRRDLARAHMPANRQSRIEQEILGRSATASHLRHAILQLSDAPIDIWIKGEHGSGREALARLIHDLSRRARRPFVALDCRAISEEAMEAELFGYERGAHAARSGERHSRFEFASGGTIYLSEIDALSSALQMRLFRSLNDRSVIRSGGQQGRAIDIRLIASSSNDLEALMKSGAFRQDLFFRLSAATLHAPSLEERREDIPQLYLYFLQQSATKLRRPLPAPNPAQLEALKVKNWPGNLAQLQAEAERQVLGLTAPPANATNSTYDDSETLAQKLARYEAKIISQALEASQGSSALAAHKLGIPRRTLNEKITRLGLRTKG